MKYVEEMNTLAKEDEGMRKERVTELTGKVENLGREERCVYMGGVVTIQGNPVS